MCIRDSTYISITESQILSGKPKWETRKCQILNVSESESVRIWNCQNLKLSESESVRIWKCQNMKVSEFINIWKCQNFQNWKGSESESVRILGMTSYRINGQILLEIWSKSDVNGSIKKKCHVFFWGCLPADESADRLEVHRAGFAIPGTTSSAPRAGVTKDHLSSMPPS